MSGANIQLIKSESYVNLSIVMYATATLNITKQQPIATQYSLWVLYPLVTQMQCIEHKI